MKEIKLTQGMVAIVDDEDYQRLVDFGKWQFDRYAYCTRKVDGKRKSVRMHRMILNPPKGLEVDHINRDKLDNRRSNLRVVDRSTNIRNQGICANKIKGLPKGIFWDKSRQKYMAHTCINYQRFNLGRFNTIKEAQKVYSDFMVEKGLEVIE